LPMRAARFGIDEHQAVRAGDDPPQDEIKSL
jgi:hypothetical protein